MRNKKRKSDALLGENFFNFNKDDNGGGRLTLTTKIYSNGDPQGMYLNQQLQLLSYCNSAVFNLVGSPMTPDLLRELANELESEILKAKNS